MTVSLTKEWEPLQCPICGGECTHHGDVTVRNRSTEDGPGLQVSVHGTTTRQELLEKDGGFRGRRDDLSIAFWCEGGCSFTMEIMQHKGTTFVRWVEAVPADGRSA
jgi:hypothetical protein